MKKVAFRSVAGKLRHAKRVLQTSPILQGTVVGGGFGGALSGYSEKKRQDAHMESKKFKKQDPARQEKYRSKRLGKILRKGVSGALSGGMLGAAWKTPESADRHAFKTLRRIRNSRTSRARSSYGSGSARGSGEARSAKVKDVGTPEWLKGVKTKADAKTKFREQAKMHHPDRGGSEEKMKKVNSEWDSFQKHHFNKLSHILPAFLDELKEIFK